MVSSLHKLASSLLALVCVMIVVGCAGERNRVLAQSAVDQFHTRLNAEMYDVAYAETDPELRRAVAKAEFVRLLETVHQKLGNVRRTTQRSYMAASFTDRGFLVDLTYDTEFAQGKAEEHFVWRVGNGVAALVRYNIESAELRAQ